MKTYDLYGTSQLPASDLCERVARLLAVVFEQRDSSYLGEYYRPGDPRGEHFVVLSNAPEGDLDEMPEPDFVDVPVLLGVNATQRRDSLRTLLHSIPELVLLRTKSV